jgi:hypothetical protein
MRRVFVNYSSKLINVHRIHDDIALFTGTRQLDGPPKGLDTIRRVEFGFGKHRGSRRFEEHQFLPCERRTGNYYTIAIVTLRTAIALYNRKTQHLRQIPIFIERPIPPETMEVDLPLENGPKKRNRR